ncbi:DNA mismatch repair protein MutS [Dokdonia sinensis]|uniref:DNA mismatch repair protein MutS n=1 Tax=Dokdonia sinensis TaxID=2479847 RepID=A0A3M0GGL5_9FLAO|nr:Smr/MutS family protein [Dokdonia sinensis]RMB64065.1 DNA mismatch repair protein MutS [Dokdonia sinensis]
MQFTIGQAVMALDDDLEGEVVAIDDEYVSVESSDGFIVRFRESELIPLKRLDKSVLSVPSSIVAQKEMPKRNATTRVKPKERNLPPMEVDLHIHQLTNQRGMSNYDMLTLQTETAERQLKFAISKRIQKVVFIHGVGKGVLRAELEYLFGRYDNVKYYDADYQKYGVGALEVYIYQNVNTN